MDGPYPSYPRHPPRPRSVLVASRLMITSVVVNLISAVVGLAQRAQLRRRVAAHYPGVDATSAFHTAFVFGLVFGIVLLVCNLVLAGLVFRGVNWARIVTWVLCGLGIFGALVQLLPSTVQLPVVRALGILQGFLFLAIAVLLAREPSTRFFRRQPGGWVGADTVIRAR